MRPKTYGFQRESSGGLLFRDKSIAIISAGIVAFTLVLCGMVRARDKFGFSTAEELRAEVAKCRKQYGNKDPQTAKSLEQLAQCFELNRSSDSEEKLKVLMEALPLRKSTYNPAKFKDAFGQAGVVTFNVAGAEYALDLYSIGEILLQKRGVKLKAAAQAKKAAAKVTLTNEQQDMKAEDVWKELLVLSGKSLGREHPTTVGFMLNLARAADNAGNYKEAEAVTKTAISIEENRNLPKEKFSRLFWALATLTDIYVDMEDDRKAEPIILRKIAYLKECDPEGPFMAGTLEEYCELLERLDRADEVKPLAAHALAIRQRTGTHQEHKVGGVIIKKP